MKLIEESKKILASIHNYLNIIKEEQNKKFKKILIKRISEKNLKLLKSPILTFFNNLGIEGQ